MKFLNNFKLNKPNSFENLYFNYKINEKYINYRYLLNHVKNRKNISNIRPGVSLNYKKNSIKRDKNFNILNQFINLNFKKGKKFVVFKNLNIMFDNFMSYLNNELEEFKRYKYYEFLINSYNNNPKFSDLNELIFFTIKDLESIFEIKTSKNNKKLKTLGTKSKYSHEIIYIPKQRRLKYVLKALSFYKEHFKKYNFWERFFWCLMMTIINKNNSFLKKRKDFIYLKSIKFFKKKKTKKIV